MPGSAMLLSRPQRSTLFKTILHPLRRSLDHPLRRTLDQIREGMNRFLLSSLFGISLAVGPAPLSGQASGSVSIQVVDEDDQPVEAATVQSGSVLIQTNAAGIAVISLPVGEREVVVSKLGFEPAELVVNVLSGTQATAVVELELAV